MNLSKTIGVILIIASLALGYIGVNKIGDNTQSVNLLGIKIDASNESGKQEGFLILGVAVVLFVGGIYTINNRKA